MSVTPMSPLFWLLLAALLWPVLWVSVLLHEAGHALAGRLAGYHVAAWGLGDGEPLLLIPPASRPARTRFFVCRRSFFSGYTGAIFPGLIPTRGRAATFVLGGPIANVLLALLGVGALRFGGAWLPVGIAVALVNAALCLMALAPGGAGGLPTDGMRLAHLLGLRPAQVPAASPQTVLDGAARWRAVHAPALVYYHFLSAASAAAQIGDTMTAERLLSDADQNLADAPGLDAYARFARGLSHEAAGNTNAAIRAFHQARMAYQSAGHQAAAWMAQIYEASNDANALNGLYAGTLSRQVPSLRTLAAARYLLAACTAGGDPPARFGTALSRYQTARLTWRSDTQDAHVFAAAAARLQDGDGAGANDLQEQARMAVKRVEYALADDRAALAAFRAQMVARPLSRVG